MVIFSAVLMIFSGVFFQRLSVLVVLIFVGEQGQKVLGFFLGKNPLLVIWLVKKNQYSLHAKGGICSKKWENLTIFC